MNTPIMNYVKKYPQLTLEVKADMKNTEEYINIVRKGFVPTKLVFPIEETGDEEIIKIETPVGIAEVLYLPNREMFEYFVRVLAYECEPKGIPDSMGAILISGITNWRKIDNHRMQYILTGGRDWNNEFKKFTSVKENYKDTVLLVSKGNYSALNNIDAGFEELEWIKISKTIRIYHEITHFICRKMFPENKNEIRDEIVADCIGIIAAIGHYDIILAKKFLGIEGSSYRKGGRLENYIEYGEIPSAIKYCNEIISFLQKYFDDNNKELFDCLIEIEKLYAQKRA